jgi:hypothetical protein
MLEFALPFSDTPIDKVDLGQYNRACICSAENNKRKFMAQDLYEILEVPDNASDVWIRRAYAQKRENIAAITPNAAERQARLAAADDAFKVLSEPVAREQYDRRNQPDLLADDKPKMSRSARARLIIWGSVSVMTVVTVGFGWQHAVTQERIRHEKERAAEEIAARARDLEARDKAQRESIKQMATTIERREAKQLSLREENARRDQDAEKRREALEGQATDNFKAVEKQFREAK